MVPALPLVVSGLPAWPGVAAKAAGVAALVRLADYGSTVWYETYFHLMATSVLSQIADMIAAHKAVFGYDPASVMVSAAEYKALRQELNAKGAVLMVNGVQIVVGTVSDLPHALPDQSGLKSAVDLVKEKIGQEVQTLETGLFKQYESAVLGVDPAAPSPADEDPYGEDPYEFTFSGFKSVAALPSTPLGPSSFKKAWDAAKAEAAHKTPVYHKSQSDEHGTPQALFDTLDQEFHFDLDVCAMAAHEVAVYDDPKGDTAHLELDPGNAKCPIYFTKADNGLAVDWFGTVWMNPPYTKGQVAVWIQKLIHEMVQGHITKGVALVAARPDTQWFHVAACYAAEIRFLKGRLTFQGSTDAAPFPSALLVFDRSKSTQLIKFWDWKKGIAVKYWKAGATAPPKTPTLASLMSKGLPGLLGLKY